MAMTITADRKALERDLPPPQHRQPTFDIRQPMTMRERDVFLWVLFAFTAMMVLFNRLASKPILHGHSTPYATTSTVEQKIKIFCFGDSLTAGMSPPLKTFFPYGPHLQNAFSEETNQAVVVTHSGFPGWTSIQLLPELQAALSGYPSQHQQQQQQQQQQQPASSSSLPSQLPSLLATPQSGYPPNYGLILLLAGTNDLAWNTANPDLVATNVIALHQTAHGMGVPHTIAVAIPPSAFQKRFPQVAESAARVNELLQDYCQTEPRATFVPFPLPYRSSGTNDNSEDVNWSTDGLHLSPRGYQKMGQSLAPIVEEILLGKADNS